MTGATAVPRAAAVQEVGTLDTCTTTTLLADGVSEAHPDYSQVNASGTASPGAPSTLLQHLADVQKSGGAQTDTSNLMADVDTTGTGSGREAAYSRMLPTNGGSNSYNCESSPGDGSCGRCPPLEQMLVPGSKPVMFRSVPLKILNQAGAAAVFGLLCPTAAQAPPVNSSAVNGTAVIGSAAAGHVASAATGPAA
ncbi:hypothetical protein OEZ85_007195 [Tetradesmus obliquus]|uniref:Uncharacterized protein n=1 Tax=Tetradesmus obliquus TaxID=3088 RepID=A0ABY8TXA9_TETOB|nr:hypothetical protein OEZ85_007195 [Tetradesmus obliquus]